MTGHIVRIRNPAIRIPLWMAYWPFAVLDCAVNTIASGNGKRLFLRDWWVLQMVVLEIGVMGVRP